VLKTWRSALTYSSAHSNDSHASHTVTPQSGLSFSSLSLSCSVSVCLFIFPVIFDHHLVTPVNFLLFSIALKTQEAGFALPRAHVSKRRALALRTPPSSLARRCFFFADAILIFRDIPFKIVGPFRKEHVPFCTETFTPGFPFSIFIKN
jgi:hypothetical protein